VVTVWKKTRHKRFPQKNKKLANMRVIHLFHVEPVKFFPFVPYNREKIFESENLTLSNFQIADKSCSSDDAEKTGYAARLAMDQPFSFFPTATIK
jgi:hypothetical protein